MRYKNLYSIFDRVAVVFGEMVFPAENDEDAKRAFTIYLKNSKDLDMTHYTLFKLGRYDRIDGIVEGLGKNKNEYVMSGIDIIKENEKIAEFPQKGVDNEK